MLYKKNSAPILSEETFKNPSAEYRCTPFWALNCKLDAEMMARQIDCFKAMGFGGAHMHVRTGLATEYLGKDFMDAIEACCDKFESLDMLGWLYDEDRYSSGYAGGKVTCDPRFRRRELHFYPENKYWNTPKEEAIAKAEPYLIACYDIILNEDGTLKSFDIIDPERDAKGSKWFAYSEPDWPRSWHNGYTYVDVMNREATEKFIETTYDLYYEKLGDRFDKSVPAIFTDEPQIMHKYMQNALRNAFELQFQRFGWSRFFEEEYFARYGENIVPLLPMLIWYCPNREDAPFKYKYYDLCGSLMQKNFCKVLGDWCVSHNIAFTGHMLDEPRLLYQMYACSECMRHYGDFGIPGIDMLSNNYQYTTAKQCQSVVHQQGKEGMMSELYGVTNWDFDFMGHKSQGDWQAALGVTVRVPHLAWLSMAGESKRDYPATISYQSPWYREYPFIENHFARLNTALTRGKAIVNIGVIHPVESMWITMGPTAQYGEKVEALEKDFENITEWLIKNHLDFDFICESTLPEMIKDDKKAVGQSRYEAIIIPKCHTLRRTTVKFLQDFANAGGKLIFTDSCPEFIDGAASDAANALYKASTKAQSCSEELADELDFAREIAISTDWNQGERFIYTYRQDTDCRWLFVARRYQANKAETDAQEIKIKIKGSFKPTEYNTVTGEICPIGYLAADGFTTISKKIYSYDSLLIKLEEADEGSLDILGEAEFCGKAAENLCWDYALSEGNVFLLDQGEYALDGGEWQPKEEMLRLDNKLRDKLGYPHRNGDLAQPYTIKIFTEGHTAQLRFCFESEIDSEGAVLAIEGASRCSFSLNGEAFANKVIGYFADESIESVALPTIKKGKNILEVSFPYREDTDIEWAYILGNFGVEIRDAIPTMVAAPEKLEFRDLTKQKMPFYGANVTYTAEISLEKESEIRVAVPQFIGAAITLDIDGERIGNLSLPPFRSDAALSAGKHKISITLFGNRFNSFGQLHCTDLSGWLGPEKWRTEGEQWTYDYCLKPVGILSEPIVTIKEK